MRKQFLSAVFLLVFNQFVNAQLSATIVPSFNLPQCPNITQNFYVDIRGNVNTITVEGRSDAIPVIVDPGSVSYTYFPSYPDFTRVYFTGHFQDDNQKQGLRVYFHVGSDLYWWDCTYRRIRSLKNASDTFDIVQTINPTAVSRDLCVTSTIDVGFAKAAFTTNVGSDGSGYFDFLPIDDYEYQIPAGWSMNSQTSTGSNWIAGGNQAYITPDGVTGHGDAIKIRPVNTCTTGLAIGRVKSIPITRSPATIFTTATKICDNSTYTFTANNIPSIATSLTWSTSSNILASTFSGSSTTVTRNSGANAPGWVKLSVGVPCAVAPVETIYPIAVGLIPPYFDIFAADGHCTGDFYEAIASSQNGQDYYTYNWTINGTPDAYQGYKIRRNFPDDYTEIKLNIQTADCSTPSDDVYRYAVCESLFFRMSPNPASSTAVIESKRGEGFTRIRILDKLGNLKSEFKYDKKNKKTTLSIAHLKPDVYTIQVFDGKKWSAAKFIKN